MRNQLAAWLRQNERIIIPAWIKLVRSRGGDRDRKLATRELEQQFFPDFYHAFTLAIQEQRPQRLVPVMDRVASARVEGEFQLGDTLDIFFLLKELLWAELAQACSPEQFIFQLRLVDDSFNDAVHFLAGAYTRETRNLLSARLVEAELIARRLATATEEADKALSRLRVLYNISRAISSTLDLKQILAIVAENLISVPQLDRCAIWLTDQGAYELSVAIVRGVDAEQLEGIYLPVSEERSVVTRAYKTRKLQIVANVDATEDVLAPLFSQRTLLAVPLEGENQPLGVITLDSLARLRPLETAIIEMVQSVADQAAVSLRNTRLYDELVQLNQELERRVEARTEELARLNQELSKLDKKKSDFITIAAHELKTPLTLVQGYAEMLAEGEDRGMRDEVLEDAVAGIVRGSGRLRAIVEDIIDVSLIDTQVLMLNLEPTLLQNIVEIASQDLAQGIQERKQTLQIGDFTAVPPVEGDAIRLHQVFVNLLSNAVKYTPDGGCIDVVGRLLPSRDGETAWVEVVVSDTGVGIDVEDQERIFDKFYRVESTDLHSTSKTRFLGAGPGLGLTIAKGIVEAHGGRIWVESKGYNPETCPGSHFHVLLPVRSAWGDFRAGRTGRASAAGSWDGIQGNS